MGKFHRFVAPSYFNAPTPPVAPASVTFEGSQYNLINVVSGGTGAGGSSFTDDAKGAGPNAGTYLVAFGEDATSSNANRGLKALAENTDLLDDILHRDVALPVRTTTTTPGAPVPSIALPAGTYVGHTVGYPIDLLFDLLDDQDREVFDSTTGAKIKVVSISGATIGDGFSGGVIVLTLNESIPTGQPYRLYYAARGNMATLPVDAFTFIKVRGAQEVGAEVESTFAQIQGPLSVGHPWNAVPVTTLYDAAYGGLNERFKRATVKDGAPPTYHPTAILLNTAGSGGWYTKGSAAGMTGYSAFLVSGASGSFGAQQEHALGAMWSAILTDTITPGAGGTDKRLSVSAGFAFLGGQSTSSSNTGISTPGIFSFYTGTRRFGGTPGTSRTVLGANTAITVASDAITIAAPNYFSTTEAGIPKSNLALGIDILRIRVGGVVHTVVPTSLDSALIAHVRYLDGSVPNFGFGGAATLVEWIQTLHFKSDGGGTYWENVLNSGAPSGVDFKGATFLVPPFDNLITPYNPEYARFFAAAGDSGVITAALAWGGYMQVGSVFKYVEKSALFGDGSAIFRGVLEANLNFHVSGGVSTFDTPIHYRQGMKSVGVSTSLTAPTIDAETAPTFIAWLLDGQNPNVFNGNTAVMTINNMISGSFNSGRVVVAIRRTSASLVNSVTFTCPGTSGNILDGSDAYLSPITNNATYWWDVYEGTLVNGIVFWKVARYRA